MDQAFLKRAIDLGFKAAPNFLDLTEEQIVYFEKNPHKIPAAISRGFVLPSTIKQDSVKIRLAEAQRLTETADLNWWIDKAEAFAKHYHGYDLDLRKQFEIPVPLPWPSVIPVFDPGRLDNRAAVKRVLSGQRLRVYQQVSVNRYSGWSGSTAPTLYLIENRRSPNPDTMEKTPIELEKTGKCYLSTRGYILAFSLYYFATGGYLDPGTFTLFPQNSLHNDLVPFGYWGQKERKVGFCKCRPGTKRKNGGARQAVFIPNLNA